MADVKVEKLVEAKPVDQSGKSMNLSTKEYYDGLVQVVFGDKNKFESKLVTKKGYKKGDVVCEIRGYDIVDEVRYTTVQVGKNKHIELNSILVYMNHSCAPNVYLDLEHFLVMAFEDVKAGDELCFFYPCSEWKMAQPFICRCGAKNCMKIISGAYFLSAAQLQYYPVCKHIKELIVDSLSQ
jgi:hypothetical protein